MFDDECFINFSNNFDCNLNIKKSEYNIYDKMTTETYRVMRELHLDPITHEKVPENLAFKFEYMWDPITGERTEKDPHGPLYFNCKNLLINFYYNRLRMLWIEGDVIENIQYEGYYGDGLCAGEDLYIPSRGITKHMHLFRLPIIDCYLEKDFDLSVITMGPKLTEEEINEINNILDNYINTNNNIKRKSKYSKNNFNICEIRDLYNIAISKSSKYKDAQTAVEKLKKMKLVKF